MTAGADSGPAAAGLAHEPAAARDVAVVFERVCKDFGATRAVRDASLELDAARVHAFVGENGAGKSTCLGVLAGRVAPTRGTVRAFGRELPGGDPRGCRAAGVVAIYQELTIVPALSAQANVFLGHPLSRRGFLSERRMRARYLELCAEVGVEPVPDGVPAGRLSVAEQQLLEIMRALVADARVILLDEPTASLALHERDALLRLMDRLRASGMTIVFVSHNLDEVLQIADTITVFRDGAIVAHGPRSEWDKPRVVRAMLGEGAGGALARELARELLEEAAPGASPAPAAPGATAEVPADPARPARPGRVVDRSGAPLLRAEGLTVPGAIEDVSLELWPGEMLGFGGLVGSGRTTVLRALAGLEPRAMGALWIDGRRVALPRTVSQAQKLGIALVPEDRKGQGLVLGMDAMNNVALGDLGAFARGGLLSRRRMAAATADAATGVGFRAERIGEVARNLSGGNQQKLLLARWRLSRPRILLADEPTRGIDIGAKAEIVDSLEQMAQAGMAIVVVSSELEEVCAMSDRVVVLFEGRQAGELERARDDVTPGAIMSVAFGLEDAPVGT